MQIKNTNNTTCAQDVLVKNGFKILSSWYNNNEFEKDGIIYGINHPVWSGKDVNVYIKLNEKK